MQEATPELRALHDLHSRLEAAGIPYMLTGSLAMAYYARPRMTRDIDVVVSLALDQVARLADALGDAFLADADAIAEAVRTTRPCNVLHSATIVKVDIIPRRPGAFRESEFSRRRRVDFGGTAAWIVSAEDLILAKLDWARDSRSELQLRDVALLLEGPVDRRYLLYWAKQLGVETLLRDASNE